MRRISKEICILGGGPAGLGAAYELASHGRTDAVIVDRNENLGGLARTESFDGNLFDVGPHRFFTKNVEVNRLWHDVLGNDFCPVKRTTRIYYGGKFFNYPLSPVDALAKIGPVEAIKALVSYAHAQVRLRNRVPENFEEWVTSKFGTKLYQAFFKTYTEKVWGIPCREIGPEWAAQRIRGLDMKALVANALGARGSKPKSLVEEFDYPRRGAGMMYEAMGDRFQEAGGTVLRSSNITGIRHTADLITEVEVTEPDGSRTSITADHFLSSIPITHLFHLMGDTVDPDTREAASELYHRDHITVNLVVDGVSLFPDQWIYLHSPDVKMARLANYNNFSDSMAADRGTTLLSVEYFVFQSDAIWGMSDEDLIRLAAEELAFTGLVGTERILKGWIVRETESYPTYYLGFDKPLNHLKQALTSITNLSTIGRGGMYKYNNMDHSLYTGLLAARNLVGNEGVFDLWAVNTDAEYLESGSRS